MKLLGAVLLVLAMAGVAGGLWLKARRAQARGVARVAAITQSRAAFEPLLRCVVGEPLEPAPQLGNRLQALIAERHEKLRGELSVALEGCTGETARLRAPLAPMVGEATLGQLQAAAQGVDDALTALIAAVRAEAARDQMDAKLVNEQDNSGGALAAARCALGAAAPESVEALATTLVDRCFKADPSALVEALASNCADKLDMPAPTAGAAKGSLPIQPRVRQALRHCLREARLRRTAPSRRQFAAAVERYLEAARP